MPAVLCVHHAFTADIDDHDLDLPFAGGVALYFVGIIFLVLGVAIVCDDFFIASLEIISEKLNLSADVAGK